MNVEIIKEPIEGIKVLKLNKFEDERGTFLKTYNRDFFFSMNMPFIPEEQYITSSKKDVIRGMHFQTKEDAHKKLVTCINGSVLDVVVDIRRDSKNFNMPLAFKLSDKNSKALLIEKGFAHGFLSLENDSTMLYMTSTGYSPNNDKGFFWKSINYDWPIKNPIISERDKNHPNLKV